MKVEGKYIIGVDYGGPKDTACVMIAKKTVENTVQIVDVLWGDEAQNYSEAMEMLWEHRKRGHWLPQYCRKGVEGCLCAVGFPPEQQCPDCREDFIRGSRCECPPKKKP